MKKSNKAGQELALEIGKALVSVYGGCIATADGMLHKLLDGEWISKPSIQVRDPDFRQCWVEEANAKGLQPYPLVQKFSHLVVSAIK